MKNLQKRQQVLINLITRVGGKNNIQKWMDELIQIDIKLEEVMNTEAKYEIVCEFTYEPKWIQSLANLWGCEVDGCSLVMNEKQFQAAKGLDFDQYAAIASKIGFDWEVPLRASLYFKGKILSPEEQAIENKKQALKELSAEEFKKFVKTILALYWEQIHVSADGGNVVDVYFMATEPSQKIIETICQLLTNEHIYWEFPAKNRLVCSANQSRIKTEKMIAALERESRKNDWYPKDRMFSDSF